jgi:hypothetical protein
VTILRGIALSIPLAAVACAAGPKTTQLPASPAAEICADIVEEEVTAEIAEKAPQAYVKLEKIVDRSSGKLSAKHRKVRAAKMREMIRKELAEAPAITLEPGSDIRQYTVDATIERLDRRVRGSHVEVVCELRLSISDRRGRMLSFLTGGVAVQVPRQTFRPQYEPQLQREALEGAAKKINRDLLAYIDSADAD